VLTARGDEQVQICGVRSLSLCMYARCLAVGGRCHAGCLAWWAVRCVACAPLLFSVDFCERANEMVTVI